MFVMKILREIVIHFSFDMIKTFVSFSGHTLSVEVQTKSPFKTYKKCQRYGFYEQRNFTIVFIAREIISTGGNLK